MSENLLVEIQGSVGIITINKEEQRNSLNIETLNNLKNVLQSFSDNKEVRAVIITGSGPKVFAAGADLKEAIKLTKEDRKTQTELGHEVFQMIENFRAPVIAAVNGHALGGGCELALACDIRIVEERAKIGLVEVGIGTIPGWGGTQRLSKIVGLGNAKEMILTGIPLSAQEAKEVGLANKVAESGTGLVLALELAEKISKNSPYAVQVAKSLVNQSSLGTLPTGIELEKKASDLIFISHDRTEGIKSFLEKRKPNFTGE
ncbi:enoyl-CoA hydratase/isomerase family protein [Oceanobacillus damuensis]|uniref:enoyl-CoA hydratase/isomerase family protein n=1 Tax=Oceanobacillus damuensis TaxID=937928 RepID=UPI0008344937|nr:enoyl-CoA hydratase-related protein [Oceanobacillus damuensis]